MLLVLQPEHSAAAGSHRHLHGQTRVAHGGSDAHPAGNFNPPSAWISPALTSPAMASM